MATKTFTLNLSINFNDTKELKELFQITKKILDSNMNDSDFYECENLELRIKRNFINMRDFARIEEVDGKLVQVIPSKMNYE